MTTQVSDDSPLDPGTPLTYVNDLDIAHGQVRRGQERAFLGTAVCTHCAAQARVQGVGFLMLTGWRAHGIASHAGRMARARQLRVDGRLWRMQA